MLCEGQSLKRIADILMITKSRVYQIYSDLLDKLENKEDNLSTLNPRQEKFVAEYLKTLNVTQSAIKAGYSHHTASEQGSRLLKNKKVAKYIDEQRKRVIDEVYYLLTNYFIS